MALMASSLILRLPLLVISGASMIAQITTAILPVHLPDINFAADEAPCRTSVR